MSKRRKVLVNDKPATHSIFSTPEFQPMLESTGIHIKLPPTQRNRTIKTEIMLKEALGALNNRKGFSLFALKKYICEKYVITLRTNRINLLKKMLKEKLEAGILVNVTGKGLNGKLKYAPTYKPRGSVSVVVGRKRNSKGEQQQPQQRAEKTPENIVERNTMPTMPGAPQRDTSFDSGVNSIINRRAKVVLSPETPRSSQAGGIKRNISGVKKN